MEKATKKERPFWAQNIVSRREAKDWSQAHLADLVGVHVNVIKKIESGKGEGELETRLAIAESLNCALADLYRSEKDIPDFLPARDFLSKFAGEPEDIRRLALAIIYTEAKYLAGLPPALQRAALSLLKAVESL